MDFYRQTGKMALGSRLRRLSERLTEDAAKIYALYEVALVPNGFLSFMCSRIKRPHPLLKLLKLLATPIRLSAKLSKK